MKVKFAGYRFLRDKLILYKNEEIIPLKHTQALLLDFFLADTDSVHSKDAIMNSVWKDKVVSEQVVFQTISQLRSLFGSDAIKTFSKKGYKWQLDITLVKTSTDKTSDLVTKNETPKVSKHSLWLAFLLLFILLAIAGNLFQLPTANEKVTLHLVQNTESTSHNYSTLTDLTNQTILQDNKFSVHLIPKVNSARQSFVAPKLAWQKANLLAGEWLLWTDVFSSPEGIFLNYGLSNDSIHWHGYFYAKTNEQLAQKLSDRLIQLQQFGLFSKSKSKLDISALTSMMEVAPNDPDILLLLANYYFEVQQFEVAMTYTKKLINLNSSYSFTPYRAEALWLTAEIYKKRRKFQLAKNSLHDMSTTLADTPLSALKYKNIHASAWIAKAQGDFETMFTILDQGLEFSSKHPDALMLFELHITYSILAKKAGDINKKYAHLNEAQSLLLKHKLDESNFAVVYYHFALFTQDRAKELPYLEKILSLPRTARNGWIIDDATEKVIDQYIEQQNYPSAISLLNQQAETPKYMLSWAKIYHATGKLKKARSYFEKSFELARLDYNPHVGSHAAFSLFQLSHQQPELQAEYMDYLERNANKEWLNEQIDSLTKK
jgi:DNA-binding winged helix-turn-helix (wHTH) protein/tetratricopeptide (TPR) repeat protein